MRYPLLARAAITAGIAAALLIPLQAIQSKVAERRERADGVQKSFASETSGPQILAGPFIALTCEETYQDEHWENGKSMVRARQRPCPARLVAPELLDVRAELPVETRRRGIYPIRLYQAKLALSGRFVLPEPPAATDQLSRKWLQAYLVLGIKDVRGIRQAPAIELGGARRELLPGSMDFGIASGLHAPLGDASSLRKLPNLEFGSKLELLGTTRFDVAPVADTSTIRIESPWPHPSFGGTYAPDRRSVADSGFSVGWSVNHYATGGGAFWQRVASAGKLFEGAPVVGLSLVDPVNVYSMSHRAVEYGFLFVLLTFAALAMVEVLWAVRLHALQYVMTGLALAVFFLLLLALSEHVVFRAAYLLAAGACVALLTHYLHAPLKSIARTGAFTALFTGLYASLYVLLSSEDHSLLLGAILVFAVLAAIMIVTRRIDWSEFSARAGGRAAAQAG